MNADRMRLEGQQIPLDERAASPPRISRRPSKMDPTAETISSTMPPSISTMDASSPSNAGAEGSSVGLGISNRKRPIVDEEEEDDEGDEDENDAETDASLTRSQPLLSSSQLGTLHSRRKKASPQKFNTGHFDPLPLSVGRHGEPSLKRVRYENKIAVSYNTNGTPRIASITPVIATPSNPVFFVSPRTPATSRLSQTGAAKERKFSLLLAFCTRNDLVLELVSYLPFQSLLMLYSTSRFFHALFNRHHTAFIIANMRTWAPDADRIYPWRCYKALCLKDPVSRQKKRYQGLPATELHLKEEFEDLRDVPSLRWLQMVIWRQGVCKDMLIQLATKGLRCPPGTLDAMKRMWFIMDLPLNVHRIACIRSTSYLTNQHLYNAQAFFLKVDMAFTAPAGRLTPAVPNTANPAQVRYANVGFVGCSLRKLLTAERHFTSLWRVLRGWSWDPATLDRPMTRLDVVRLWVRHKYTLPDEAPPEARRMPILDIPWHEIGTASLERTGVALVDLHGSARFILHPALVSPDNAIGLAEHRRQQLLYPHDKRLILPSDRPREVLLRPEQLVLREAIRRQMGLHRHWVHMMLYGLVDEFGHDFRVLSEQEYSAWEKGKKPDSLVLPMQGEEEEDEEGAEDEEEEEEEELAGLQA
nr:hypothetical protein CFP56_30761 [Quercus suber]